MQTITNKYSYDERTRGGLYLFDEEIEELNDTNVGEMTCEDALITAFYALTHARRKDPDHVHLRKAQAMLRMILAQRGLDHLGSDCRDGKLTTYMDTVIFG